MENIERLPNSDELTGKYGTPKITIAFMIKRYEEEYYPNEKPKLSRDIKSTICRALEIEFYDGLYKELHQLINLSDSVQVAKNAKESAESRIREILEFMKYDILGEIKCLEEQSKQKKITLFHPFLNYKMYFSRKVVIAKLKFLKTKYSPNVK